MDVVLSRQGITHEGAQAAARESITRGKLLSGALAGVLVMPLARLLEATYLWSVARLLDAAGSFRTWFSLACWSSLPELLAFPAIAVNIHRARGGRLLPERLDPTTLAAVVDLDPASAWFAVCGILSLPLLLKAGILAAALRSRLGTSWPTSLAIVAAPYAAIAGACIGFVAAKG